MLKEEACSSACVLSENICTMDDLFDKTVAEGAR